MNSKGFFGMLLLIIGAGISLLAGGCALLLFIFMGGAVQVMLMPWLAFLAGLLIVWCGNALRNSAGRDPQPEKERKKAEPPTSPP